MRAAATYALGHHLRAVVVFFKDRYMTDLHAFDLWKEEDVLL
jgi:hypothetical protein